MSNVKPLARRTFIQGMGLTMGLPLLEAMIPARAMSAVTAPKRFFAFYIPNGSYLGNKFTGRNQGLWVPAGTTFNGASIPLALKPLSAYASDMVITSNVSSSVLNGRRNRADYPDGKVPERHGANSASFLACSPAKLDAAGTFLDAMMYTDSIDQLILKDLASKGTYTGKSLVINATTKKKTFVKNPALNGGAFGQTITIANGRPQAPIYDCPSILSTFFSGAGPGPSLPELRAMYSRSLLDYMSDSIARLKSKLGTSDVRLMDQYLTEYRDLEKKFVEINKPDAGTCAPPTGSDTSLVGTGQEAGPHFTNLVDWGLKAAHFGMKCDRVRVGGLMFGNDPSNTYFKKVIPPSLIYDGAVFQNGAGEYYDDHLDTAHHDNNDEKIKRLITVHHMECTAVAKFVEYLKTTTDVDGSPMLDNTVVMVGSGFGDGLAHSDDDLVRAFIGGKNMGLGGGRHFDMRGAEMSKIFLGLIRKFGVAASSFGYGSGKSTEAFEF